MIRSSSLMAAILYGASAFFVAGAVAGASYSPYADADKPNQVIFGDTHLHSSYSTDAGMIGNTLGPEAALRFARGEPVQASKGQRARLVRPLDFLVIADHAETLGLAPMIAESNPALLADPQGKVFHDLVKSGEEWEAYQIWKRAGAAARDPMPNPELQGMMWERLIEAVDKANQPGVFSAFHGFEWSSSPGLRNLHRVVIFRDEADRVRQVRPYSFFDSADPEDLWDYLENYEMDTGGRVLAIPHNGNLSQGLMFSVERMDGSAFDQDYAQRRMRFEPLYEVTQIKGDAETHPALSPDDPFADYYTWDTGDFGLNSKEPWMLPAEYARSALKQGLQQQASMGANPFKFGMIGSSDSHTSLATTREENFFGKFSGTEPGEANRFLDFVSQDLRPDGDGSLDVYHWQSAASGLAAVWARENTREAIWDALARKEVYATTGSRMRVRVFAGWDFSPVDLDRPDFAATAYSRGVPMGGDLPPERETGGPRFLVRAQRDPDGANLDRIQIVKGWRNASGQLQERVYDVAVSGARSIAEDGRAVAAVGSTVDLTKASYSNSIGAPYLQAWWQDPDFVSGQLAFYYVRVLEIPTPSWVAYDEARLPGQKAPPEAVREQQERAYTSPIWYSPGGS